MCINGEPASTTHLRMLFSLEARTARTIPAMRFMQHNNSDIKSSMLMAANKYELVNRSLDRNDPAIMNTASTASITNANFIEVIKPAIRFIGLFTQTISNMLINNI
jgi:hypothetical protein